MLIHKFHKEGRLKEVCIEKCVLDGLSHPAIVKFYTSFRQGSKVFLLVEYCHNGSLSNFLIKNKNLASPLIRHYAAEMVNALAYLRKMEIVHRDLKPGNIVLDHKYHLKLIDFATCKIFNKDIAKKAVDLKSRLNLGASVGLQDDNDIKDSRAFSLVGTEEYIAPETINDIDVSYGCDLWSFGVILYELACGYTPFKGNNLLETY